MLSSRCGVKIIIVSLMLVCSSMAASTVGRPESRSCIRIVDAGLYMIEAADGTIGYVHRADDQRPMSGAQGLLQRICHAGGVDYGGIVIYAERDEEIIREIVANAVVDTVVVLDVFQRVNGGLCRLPKYGADGLLIKAAPADSCNLRIIISLMRVEISFDGIHCDRLPIHEVGDVVVEARGSYELRDREVHIQGPVEGYNGSCVYTVDHIMVPYFLKYALSVSANISGDGQSLSRSMNALLFGPGRYLPQRSPINRFTGVSSDIGFGYLSGGRQPAWAEQRLRELGGLYWPDHE